MGRRLQIVAQQPHRFYTESKSKVTQRYRDLHFVKQAMHGNTLNHVVLNFEVKRDLL